jgi:hypothetical protein
MCSIVGSFSVEKFKELLELNKSRGSFSYSLTVIDSYKNKSTTTKDFGDFDLSLLDNIPKGAYLLGHCQAPTNGLHKLVERIHPYVMKNGSKILHNGIIKTKSMKILNEKMGTNYEWDTQALAEYISSDLISRLADIEGSFACVLIEDNTFVEVFRNAIAPLFTDDNGNLSSTKFKSSISIKENTFYLLSFVTKSFLPIGTFINTHNPYYFQ